MKVPNMIGMLENRDVNRAGVIQIHGRPVKRAILLIFMPTCPHCQEPKKWMENSDVSAHDVYKLAVDVSKNNRLTKRVPSIFGFDEAEFTVPKVYVVRDGRPIKMLRNINRFDPERAFRSLPRRKHANKKKSRRNGRAK